MGGAGIAGPRRERACHGSAGDAPLVRGPWPLDAAYEALKRMHGVLEAAVAIDWVRLDAGMQGEQHPLAVDDLRIAQVRRTVLAGLVLEAVQALPLGLTAICLAPWALGDVGGPVPVRPLIVLGLSWTALAVVGARRRSERLPLAWVLGGTGASACAVVLLLLLDGLDGAGRWSCWSSSRVCWWAASTSPWCPRAPAPSTRWCRRGCCAPSAAPAR